MKAANRVAMLWVFVMAALAARNVSGQDCQWFLDWHGTAVHAHHNPLVDMEWRRVDLKADFHQQPNVTLVNVDYDNGISIRFTNGLCEETIPFEVDESWTRTQSYSIGGTVGFNVAFEGAFRALVASASAMAGSDLSFTGSLSVTNEYSITLRSTAPVRPCEMVSYRATTDVQEVHGSISYSSYRIACRSDRTGEYNVNTCGDRVFTCIAKGNVNRQVGWYHEGYNQACRDACNEEDNSEDEDGDDGEGDDDDSGGGGSGGGCIDDYVEGDILLCGDYCGTLIGLFVTPQLGDILDPNPEDPCSSFETFDDIGFGIRLEVMVR